MPLDPIRRFVGRSLGIRGDKLTADRLNEIVDNLNRAAAAEDIPAAGNPKGTLASTDDLPDDGNTTGDFYVIDGTVWYWSGTAWTNQGSLTIGETGAAAALRLMGTKATTGDLPTLGNVVNDVWIVEADDHGWAWTTDHEWVDIGTMRGPQGPGGEDTELRARVDPGADGNDYEVLAWRDGAPTYIPQRSAMGITVAASESMPEAKAQADFHPDSSGSDSDHLQTAIDQSQTYVTGSTAAVPVILMPGSHRWTSGITAKSADIIGGAHPNQGVRVFWDGTDGVGTAITKDYVTPGGGSYWALRNVNFRNGTGHPDTWLDFSGLVDVGARLDEVYFGGGRVQIHMGGQLNAHWAHLRFDNWQDYAVVADGAYALGTTVIENFTADGGSAGGNLGFIHFDNSTEDLANWGVFHLKDGRIELQAAWDASGPQAIFHLETEQARFLGLHLEDVTFKDASSQATSNLFFHESVASGMSHLLMLENVRQEGLTDVIAGSNLSSFMADVPLQAHYPYSIIGGTPTTINNLGLYPATGAGSIGVFLRKSGETQNRWQVDNNGLISFGSGSGAVDTTLGRGAANVVALGADDSFKTGKNVTASRPSAATVGEAAQFYDTTLGKPIWSNGTVWKDAAGTTV